MHKVWTYVCLAVPLCTAALCIEHLRTRLDRLERTPRVDPSDLRALDRQLSVLGTKVQSSIATLDALAAGTVRTVELDSKLAQLHGELRDASCSIDDQRALLAQLERQQENEPKLIDERLDKLRQGVEQRWGEVDDVAARAIGLAERTRESIDQIELSLTRDKDRMWNDLLGPTVQIMGEETVGSGVLLASEPVEGTLDWVTHVVTAWHVIRDIQTAPENLNTPVPVTIYGRDGKIRPETAQLLRYDATLDIALLRLNSNRPVDCGARLATRDRLKSVAIFEQIYAVGCPLGNDPIPTFGEIADTHHLVDGQSYWMISAPTYIGNSGGGVFDAETHELLGIFTKIYTHGTLRPTVVPHMGLATPLPAVYDWLEQVGFARLEPVADAQTQTAAAKR
jgi:S1-C subfamily serine protease